MIQSDGISRRHSDLAQSWHQLCSSGSGWSSIRAKAKLGSSLTCKMHFETQQLSKQTDGHPVPVGRQQKEGDDFAASRATGTRNRRDCQALVADIVISLG